MPVTPSRSIGAGSRRAEAAMTADRASAAPGSGPSLRGARRAGRPAAAPAAGAAVSRTWTSTRPRRTRLATVPGPVVPGRLGGREAGLGPRSDAAPPYAAAARPRPRRRPSPGPRLLPPSPPPAPPGSASSRPQAGLGRRRARSLAAAPSRLVQHQPPLEAWPCRGRDQPPLQVDQTAPAIAGYGATKRRAPHRRRGPAPAAGRWPAAPDRGLGGSA